MLYLLSQGLGDALSHTVRMVTGISQDVISEDHEGCGEHELPCNGRGCGRYVVMGAFKLRGTIFVIYLKFFVFIFLT